MRERITTGMEGLDKMLFGGIPEGNQVILAGGPGAGKTLFCMEFLYKNAQKGLNGIMLSLEESKEQIMQNTKDAFSTFAEMGAFVDSGKINLYDVNSLAEIVTASPVAETKTLPYLNLLMGRQERVIDNLFKNLEANLSELLKKSQAKVIAIDNLTIVKNLISDPYEYRIFVTDMSRIIKGYGITSVVVTDVADPGEERLIFDPEYFGFDGIINMYSSRGIGKKDPFIEVIKMRGTDHSYRSSPYRIGSSGIRLSNLEEE